MNGGAEEGTILKDQVDISLGVRKMLANKEPFVTENQPIKGKWQKRASKGPAS